MLRYGWDILSASLLKRFWGRRNIIDVDADDTHVIEQRLLRIMNLLELWSNLSVSDRKNKARLILQSIYRITVGDISNINDLMSTQNAMLVNQETDEVN